MAKRFVRSHSPVGLNPREARLDSRPVAILKVREEGTEAEAPARIHFAGQAASQTARATSATAVALGPKSLPVCRSARREARRWLAVRGVRRTQLEPCVAMDWGSRGCEPTLHARH